MKVRSKELTGVKGTPDWAKRSGARAFLWVAGWEKEDFDKPVNTSAPWAPLPAIFCTDCSDRPPSTPASALTAKTSESADMSRDLPSQKLAVMRKCSPPASKCSQPALPAVRTCFTGVSLGRQSLLPSSSGG